MEQRKPPWHGAPGTVTRLTPCEALCYGIPASLLQPLYFTQGGQDLRGCLAWCQGSGARATLLWAAVVLSLRSSTRWLCEVALGVAGPRPLSCLSFSCHLPWRRKLPLLAGLGRAYE